MMTGGPCALSFSSKKRPARELHPHGLEVPGGDVDGIPRDQDSPGFIT